MNVNDTLQYLNYGLPEDILRRKLHGDFSGTIRLIDRRLAEPGTPDALKHSLQLQRQICQLLPAEFPYTKEEALHIINEKIPDCTMTELEELMDARRIRWIYVDGQERIFQRFFSSLCKAVPDFGRRAGEKLSGVESSTTGSAETNRLDTVMRKMKQSGSMTNHIRVRATVKLNEEFFAPGMLLRAHLPIPAACDQQTDIHIEKIWPDSGVIAPENAAQRTICWEKVLQENQEFGVEYSYLHTATYTNAYDGAGLPGKYDFDTEEQAPHIVFTPYIRALCQALTDGLQDPLQKAKAFYDFITLNMHYTYMPSYALLENIADNCAKNHTGDCGIFALLFITLCRCAGIPAQWQSGLTAEPDFIGAHDWARFYIEPYGWLYADPSYGTSAVRVGNEERRQFYFGNLDPYRMVANSKFQKNFDIPKNQFRADPYDNQSGEMESHDRGYLFEEYEQSKEILCCEEV